MTTLKDYGAKLLYIIGRERNAHSPAEVLEAEAEVLGLIAEGRCRRGIALLVGLAMIVGGISGYFAAWSSARQQSPSLNVSFEGMGRNVLLTDSERRLALRELQLPSRTDTGAVSAYCRKIMWLMGDICQSDMTKMAMEKLGQIGPENVELLYECAGFKTQEIVEVIATIIQDNQKDSLVKALERNENLAGVVRLKKWQHDAKETLLRLLLRTDQSRGFYYPTSFIEAVADLDDRRSHEQLLKYLEQGNNPAWTYAALKRMSTLDRTLVLERAWPVALKDKQLIDDELLEYALGMGKKEALGVLVTYLPENTGWRYGPSAQSVHAMSLFRKYVTAREELVENEIPYWYRTNANKLTFNSIARKFEI